VVVTETHDGVQNRILSEERFQKIMKDTAWGNGGFLDLGETDGGEIGGSFSSFCLGVQAQLGFLFSLQKTRTT